MNNHKKCEFNGQSTSYQPKEICKCGATMEPCFCQLQEWKNEEQKPSTSCVEIDVRTNVQSSGLLARIIWQHLFNLYREHGGDLSKMDSLLCDLRQLEIYLDELLRARRSWPPNRHNEDKIHLQWSFDPYGLTWINTEYCPESNFNYWIDWSGNRDEPIKISRI